MKKVNTEWGVTPNGNVINAQEAYRDGLISMAERDAVIALYRTAIKELIKIRNIRDTALQAAWYNYAEARKILIEKSGEELFRKVYSEVRLMEREVK